MSSYKVPQDVEAEDKLLGPFSFRQFIYLVIAALGIGVAWALGNLFLPLAILPVPVILLFGALALPLRKDQPMEVYLAAVVSFYLKPRRRLWQPDGLASLVEVTAPSVVEAPRGKSLSQEEAERRLSYLADIVDTGGWAVRGISAGGLPGGAINSDVVYEAQQTPDVMDEAASIARTFDSMIEKNDERRRQQIMERMKNPAAAPAPTPAPAAAIAQPAPAEPAAAETATTDEPVKLDFNPYPAGIRQSVIKPLSESPQANPEPAPPAPESTSLTAVSPDIIKLANQRDLSVQTIAHEANRLNERQQEDKEVVISLR